MPVKTEVVPVPSEEGEAASEQPEAASEEKKPKRAPKNQIPKAQAKRVSKKAVPQDTPQEVVETPHVPQEPAPAEPEPAEPAEPAEVVSASALRTLLLPHAPGSSKSVVANSFIFFATQKKTTFPVRAARPIFFQTFMLEKFWASGWCSSLPLGNPPGPLPQ